MSATPWTNASPASVSRKNKTSVISDTGANLATYNKALYKIVTCTSTGGGFTQHHTYYFGDDGTTVVDLTELLAHYHTGGSDGGTNIYTWMKNPEDLMLYLSRPTDLVMANWNQTVTGTGSIENGGGGTSNPYIRLRTNGTSGSGATIGYTNGRPATDFAAPSQITWVGNFETASSLAFHGGVNCDDVTVADTNTVKYQAEVCTTTNNNWWLRTATGSANSASDVGIAIDTSDRSVRIYHDPWDATPTTYLDINAAGSFAKTTNIPTSSTGATQGSIQKFSVKNSTGADRPYRFKGSSLYWRTNATWGYGDQ